MRHKWTKLHHVLGNKSPCTGIDTNVSDVVTVGEDGSINVLRIGGEQSVRRIGEYSEHTGIV